MKEKALVLAVCLAIATPTISAAKILPNDLIGLSFGEIKPKSFLGEPFKGLIPILFADIKASKKLNIKIAPKAIFEKMGAEKSPILSNLNFQIKVQGNNPVILIQSTLPIKVPFLNFILEIETPNGLIYQDYTTLLDPRNHTGNLFTKKEDEETLKTSAPDYQLLAPISSSSSITLDKNKSYVVKSGDTLSEIAQALSSADISFKRMIKAIYQKNPNAFVQNDINRLKAGNVLNIPNNKELLSAIFNTIAKTEIKKTARKSLPKEFTSFQNDTYLIKKGDNLSSITKNIVPANISFTKMMKAIHTANPHAFSKNRINLLKVGEVLKIPSISKKPRIEPTDKAAPNLIVLEDTLVEENVHEFKLDGFIIEKGDTLASVSKQIGYKGISQPKMMQAIYLANPKAFDKNNITTLIEGAIIRLPSASEVENIINNATPNTKDEFDQFKDKRQSSETSGNNSIAVKKLEKRVRELKRDLKKAVTDFSNLEATLLNKESTTKEQSESLQQLATSISSIKESQVSALKKNNITNNNYKDSDTQKSNISSNKINHSLPKKDSAKNPAISLISETKKVLLPLTIEELLAAKMGKSYLPRNIDEQLVTTTKSFLKEYGIYMSGKELMSTILALLLGLLLIRYRREIYSYTNISYDHPKYYPPFDEATAKEVLKERPITFHDTTLSTIDKNTPKFSGEHIEECEELVEELIDDLNIKTNSDKYMADWDHLNKACDDYIAEYKNEIILENSDFTSDISDNSKKEEMTFELFEALAEGVATQEADIIPDNNDGPLIYGLDDRIVSIPEHVNAIPPIFDDLVKLSENTDVEKMYIK